MNKPKLNAQQFKVLQALQDLGGKADAWEIGRKLGYPNGHAVSKSLMALRRRHLVSSVAKNPGGGGTDKWWFILKIR